MAKHETTIRSNRSPDRSRRATVFVGMIIAIVYAGLPATAHTVSDSGWTYTSSSICAFNYSEAGHGAGGGEFYTEVWSDFGSPVGCVAGNIRQIGDLRAGFDLLRWDSSWGWTICKSSPWYHNVIPDVALGVVDGPHAFAPCGAGLYGLLGLGYVREGGVWRGGVMWSWEHWL